jgi:hypothetical protein
MDAFTLIQGTPQNERGLLGYISCDWTKLKEKTF